MKRLVPLIVLLCAVCVGEDTVTTHRHSTVQLPCHFPFITGWDDLTVVWVKKAHGKELLVHMFHNGQDDLSGQDPHYKGRTALSKEPSQSNLALTLTGVTFRDGGTYYCRAATSAKPGSKTVKLSVTGNIYVTAHSPSTVELPCHFPFVQGVEDLNVVWVKKEHGRELVVHGFRDGQDNLTLQDPWYSGRTAMYGSSHGNLTLTLNDASPADGGTYECRAANANNRGSMDVILSITGNITVAATLHSTMELPCHFPFIQGVKNLSVVWVKVEDGRELVVHEFRDGQENLTLQDPRYSGRTAMYRDLSHGNLTLTLRNVSSADEGTYECRAANDRSNGSNVVLIASTEPGPGPPMWAITVYIAAAFVVLLLVIGIYIYWKRRQKKRLQANANRNVKTSNDSHRTDDDRTSVL